MEDKRPEDRRLFDGEYRLMDLIWENEPVRSMELAGICLRHWDGKSLPVIPF